MPPNRRHVALAAAASAVIAVAVGALRWLPSPQPTALAGERPSVIFIVIETLRADHVRALGHGRNTMPILEDVAREGILFERAISAAPWTLPSVSSILTGLSPSVHGVTEYDDILPDAAQTLAERFHGAGYQTAFFGVNSLFEADRNLEQGFDRYYGIDEIPGTQLNEQLAAFLRHRADPRPLFMYVHYFEPHCRYEPPPEMHEMYLPAPPSVATGRRITEEQLRSMHECFHLYRQSGEPILDLDHYLGEYDAEIRYADTLMGLFLERLKTAGIYDDALIAILGDHGEEFWEHGDFGHGKTLNEIAIHVPLVIKPLAGARPQRFAAPVSTLDLAPTALGVAGLPLDPRMEGADLSPLWSGGEIEALRGRPIFSETDYEGHHQRSVHQGDLKLIVTARQGRPQLYDLRADPAQRRDLATERPAEVSRLGHLLEAHIEEERRSAEGIGGGERPISEEVIERLRALGYTL